MIILLYFLYIGKHHLYPVLWEFVLLEFFLLPIILIFISRIFCFRYTGNIIELSSG